MVTDAYQTTLLKNFKFKGLRDALSASIVRRESQLIDDASQFGKLYAVIEKSDIPVFNYPVIIDDIPGRDTCCFIDLRLHTRGIMMRGEQVDIQPGSTAEVIEQMAFLAMRWRYGSKAELLTFNFLPFMLFSQWLAESISRKLGLTADIQVYLSVLFGTYYLARDFTSESDFDEHVKTRYAVIMARQFRLQPDFTDRIMNRLTGKDLLSLDALVDFIRRDGQSVRLDRIQLKDIYNLVMGGWFGGPNARELVCVALEYPPAFISMVYQAVTNRSYKKTPLSQLFDRYKRSYPEDEFVRSYRHLLRS